MINLLPIEEKKIIQAEEKWRMILILGVLVLSFFLCLILILSSLKFYIAGKVEEQKVFVETKIKGFKESETLKESIIAANKNFQRLNIFYQEPSLSDTLDKISSILSPGIYLNDFSYQKQNLDKENIFNIVISGFAPSPETLFEFKNNLQSIFSTKVETGESLIKPEEFRLIFNITVKKTE